MCACVRACVCYHSQQHGQHFLVDEIFGEVEQDVSIVGLQSRAASETETFHQKTCAESLRLQTLIDPVSTLLINHQTLIIN